MLAGHKNLTRHLMMEIRSYEPPDAVHAEVDVSDHASRGQAVPAAKSFKVRIDDQTIVLHTQHPTGTEILAAVDKYPCAYELIAEFTHQKNCVIEPDETIDLRTHGLKGFITAHKEIVTITINNDPYQIDRGTRTVAEVLSKVGQTPDGYILLVEKNGPPMPIPPNQPIHIHGCEVFHSQPQSGGSS